MKRQRSAQSSPRSTVERSRGDSYIGLAPKLYSLVFSTDCGETVEIAKAKGIPGFVLKGEGFEAYKQQLENPKDNEVTYHRIMKHRQSTYLAETTRRGVCAVDTKTFRLDDNNALPLGHWRIEQLRAGLRPAPHEGWLRSSAEFAFFFPRRKEKAPNPPQPCQRTPKP